MNVVIEKNYKKIVKPKEYTYYHLKGGINSFSYTFQEKRDINIFKTVIGTAYSRICSNAYTRVGVEVMGPLITGYTLWLNRIAKENNVDKILFLSREGEAFREVYNTIFETSGDTYLYISRISMIRSCIKLTKSAKQLMLLVSGLLNHIQTVSELCLLIGLNDKEKERLKTEKGIDLNENIHQIQDYNFLYEAFLYVGNDTFEMNYNNAVSYFRQKGIKDGNRILLSDIGWSGTMQYLLCMMFPNVEFIGGYLAVNNFHKEPEYMQLNRKGYVCDSSTWKERGQEIRFTTVAIESLLQNSDGTVLGYEKDVDGVKVIMESRKDKEKISRSVYNLRKGYLAFAKCFQEFWSNKELCEICVNAAFLGYKNFAVTPSLDTVKFFSHYINLDDLTDANIVSSHSLAYYVFHPKEFYKEFDLTNAKIIWLKSIFKLPLPYFEFLRFLTEKINMTSGRHKFNENI